MPGSEQATWNNLENSLKEYAQYKIQLDVIKARQDELKAVIIADMDTLGIKGHEVLDNTDEYSREIKCTLVQPTDVIFNLEAVKVDIPTAVKYETQISLDDDEHIAAFKIKLKEYGLSDVKIRDIINNYMTVHKTESVDEKAIQRKFDKGIIKDISKYAKVINMPKYIRTTVTEKAANV